MLSKKLRLALPVAAAAVMAAVVPTGTAHAIDRVNCGPSDYLQIWYHFPLGETKTRCFANKGYYDFTTVSEGVVWVEKISTGNNAVRFYDTNGSTRDYRKNFIITFPNNPPEMAHIEIL